MIFNRNTQLTEFKNLARYAFHREILLIFLLSLFLITSCSNVVDEASNGDRVDLTAPVVILSSLNGGEKLIGEYTITWITDEEFPNTVEIKLSLDGGRTFPTLIESNTADSGELLWDTSTTDDCQRCRIGITATDVAGNISTPVTSAADFTVNNYPEIHSAIFFDPNFNGPDSGDSIVISFDKIIDTSSPVPSNFRLPVVNDRFGINASVAVGPQEYQLTINLRDPAALIHIKRSGQFNSNATLPGSSSAIDVVSNIPEGMITARDTGLTAKASASKADILGGFSIQQIVTTFNPVALAAGDIDNDGDIDFVSITADPFDQILFNRTIDATNPQPNVFEGVRIDVGYLDTYSVALGDIDNDGDLDLAVGGNPNKIYINRTIDDGNPQIGVFEDSNIVLGSNNTASLIFADIDNDGDVDLIAAHSSNQANQIYINRTIDPVNMQRGVFENSNQNLGSSSTRNILLADFDMDGDLDMVAINNANGASGQANIIYLNRTIDASNPQVGKFEASPQSLNNNLGTIALGDIDGDGDIDLVAGNLGFATPGIEVYLNRTIDTANPQKAIFEHSGQGIEMDGVQSIVYDSLVLADIDDDGDLDILSSDGTNTTHIYLNLTISSDPQPGVFKNPDILVSTGLRDILLQDIDGDGDLDMIGNDSTENIIFLLNATHVLSELGRFQDTNQLLSITNPGKTSTPPGVLGDIDNDGDLDIVANEVFFNKTIDPNGIKTGFFEFSGQSIGESDVMSYTLGDVDNDGDLDLLLATHAGFSTLPNKIYYNLTIDGANPQTGVFVDSGQLLGDSNTRMLLLGDIDLDGDNDIVAGNGSLQVGAQLNPLPNRIYFNKTIDQTDAQPGVFDIGIDIDLDSVPHITVAIALGDIDNDGDLDIVAGNSQYTINQLYINKTIDSANQAKGEFYPPVNIGVAASTNSILLLDIDNDNDLDLVTVETINAVVSNKVYFNKTIDATNPQKGVFEDSGQVFNGTSFKIFAVDFDRDTDLDLIINELFLNQTVDSFSPMAGTLNTSSPSLPFVPSLVGDINNNGWPDFINLSTGQIFANDY